MRTIITMLFVLLQLSSVAQRSDKKFNSNTLQLANEGNVNAMFKAALVYQADENYAEALKWFQKAAEKGFTRAWANLGLMYKRGEGTPIDYDKAFFCFSKAAEGNDSYGEYLMGYMLFKGLGCKQDYEAACKLFRKRTTVNKVNYPGKMYMLAICMRNGYGTPIDIDSAKYWLSKSAAIGYKFSIDELMAKEAENPEGAGTLAQKIKTAISAIDKNYQPVNKYTLVEHSMPASNIEGDYEGYLIKYDWSGKYIIDVTKLTLSLIYNNGVVTGLWSEKERNISVKISAHLTKDGLVFNNTQYASTDHYSPIASVLFNFENAKTQLVKIGDSSYLSGNLQLFSPDRKEPEKPMQIALVKIKSSQNKNVVEFTNTEGIKEEIPVLKVYPNPFTDLFKIEFSVKQKSQVFTQILTVDGKIVFTTEAATLETGSYVLPLQPNLSSGTYIIKVMIGKETRIAKLIKL